MASDLDTLLEMGFEKSKAELAVKKSGGCNCAPFRRKVKFTANGGISAGCSGVAGSQPR